MRDYTAVKVNRLSEISSDLGLLTLASSTLPSIFDTFKVFSFITGSIAGAIYIHKPKDTQMTPIVYIYLFLIALGLYLLFFVVPKIRVKEEPDDKHENK
jgi:hypothetical protein